MTSDVRLLRGNLIWSSRLGELSCLPGGWLAIDDGGLVAGVWCRLPGELAGLPVDDQGDRLIIPGFVDLHVHAAQFENRGLGLDLTLLPWLERFTFPEEARFADMAHADAVYRRFVTDLWRQGTTRAAVFATVHRPATERLMTLLNRAGLVACVGKVNMDRNAPDYLVETTDRSLAETKRWLDGCDGGPVRPILTPRFVPSCTPELMDGLGRLARERNLPVQSHLDETPDEIAWVKKLHPDAASYTQVYDRFGLLGPQTLMAHGVYPSDDEIDLLARRHVTVVHCPTSNVDVASGIAPVRRLLDAGLSVGLGSDVSGGHTLSMIETMRCAIQMSKMRSVHLDHTRPLTVPEAFYLATKGGGAFFGRVGSFEPGYEADLLVIDDRSLAPTRPLSLEERLERFVYLGDDRHITARWVRGRPVPPPDDLCLDD